MSGFAMKISEAATRQGRDFSIRVGDHQFALAAGDQPKPDKKTPGRAGQKWRETLVRAENGLKKAVDRKNALPHHQGLMMRKAGAWRVCVTW